MDAQILFMVLIAILILQFCWERLVSWLNARNFDKEVPPEVADVYEPEEYQKSQAYKKENYRFSLFSAIAGFALLMLFFWLDGFRWADQWAASMSAKSLPRALYFFGLLIALSEIGRLPLSWYHTFVIEEKYGFNKTTPATFFTDRLKMFALTAVLGGGLLSLLIILYQKLGSQFWWICWLVFALISLLLNTFYSQLIVPLFNKQSRLGEGPLREAIEQYANDNGFRLKDIFVIDGSKRSTKANAYFSGLGRQKRITLYDTLIEKLNTEEIVAVLAHETGHYRKKHLVWNLGLSLVFSFLTLYLLNLFLSKPEFSLALGVDEPSIHAALVAFGIFFTPFSMATGVLMNAISRKFEYQADAFARTTYGAEPMITALKKLARTSLSNLTPHQLYIWVHYSHPSLAQRIGRLLTQKLL